MSRYRKIFNRIFASIFLVVLLVSLTNNLSLQDGEALFKANCASCHKPDKDFTGPALKGWKDRIPGGDWIYKWVHNPAAMISKMILMQKHYLINGSQPIMTPFPQLKNEEIDAIMNYVDD